MSTKKTFEEARLHIEPLFDYKFRDPDFLREALQASGPVQIGNRTIPADGHKKIAVIGETAIDLFFLCAEWNASIISSENIQDRRANSEHSDVMAAWGKRRGLRECITGEGAVDEELAEKELLATTVHAILGAIYLDSDYSLLRVASPALMMMNATT